MTTIQSSIEAALFARVASLVMSPALPVAWPNLSFNPPAAGYIRVTHLPNVNRRLFLGSNDPHQRLGLLQLSVFMPKNAGVTVATEIAGKIAAHFPADLPMRSGGITVRVGKAPDIAPGFAEDTHWHVPVTISYQAIA